MSQLSPEQAAQLAYAAGFRGQNLVNIVAIMGRESGYNPGAYNGNVSTGDNSVGLTQINMIGSLGQSRLQMLQGMGYNVQNVEQAKQLLKDPKVNLQMAYAISNNGTDLSPWGGYKGMSNTYNTDIAAAQRVVNTAVGGPGMAGGYNPITGTYDPSYIDPNIDYGSIDTGGDSSGSAAGDNPDVRIVNGVVFYKTVDSYGNESWVSAGQAPNPQDSVDHYGDVSANQQAVIDEQRYEHDNMSAADTATNQVDQGRLQLDQATLKQRQAEADRDYALRVGDQALAIQKQSDANYWQGEANRLAASQQSLDARGQDLNYQGKLADIAQAKRSSDQNFQIGMANATNDQQRNQIAAQWNAEQAAIAKMEDETKRILGAQQNQTAQFGAETNRQVGMGNLALDNNKFIADMASGARGADLFSLYFMQRGLAPDFNTMAAGGQLAHGAALAPADVMHAYTPTTAAPVFNGTPQNQSAAQVGKASAAGVAASNANNSFIGAFSGGDGGGAPAYTPAPWSGYTPGAGPQQVVPQSQMLPQGDPSYSGVPRGYIEGVKPGESATVTTGGAGPSRASDFTGFNVYDAKTGQQITGQVDPGQTVKVVRLAGGGYTRARRFMAGDAAAPNPSAGGAVPEMIENPTGAPLRVKANPMNLMRFGVVPRFAAGTDPIDQNSPWANAMRDAMNRQLLAQGKPAYDALGQIVQGVRDPIPQAPLTALGFAKPQPGPERPRPAPNTQFPAQPIMLNDAPQYDANGALVQPHAPQQQRNPFAMRMAQFGMRMPWMHPQAAPQAVQSPMFNNGPTPRYALGTDTAQAYTDQGMSDSYIPTSNNGYISNGPAPLPTRLQALANYGFPITPGLYAGNTGQTLPANNLGGAFTVGRQAGVLPSLQTLNGMTPGEQELEKGYAEGVAKVPWKDLIAYLGNATKSLGSAQRSRAA